MLVPGCATFAPRPSPPQEVPVPLLSGTGARMTRVQEIRSSASFGGTPGFWASLWKFVVGEKESPVVRPYGLYADAAGRLAVADPGLGAVHLFDRRNAAYRTIYFRKDGKASPIGITGDGAESIWFSDSAAGVVMRYSTKSGDLRPFVVNLSRPTGIAFNRTNGLIYVAETGRHEVVGFDAAGKEQVRFGGRGTKPGTFNFPTDLCVDGEGRIVVTNALNARIQVVAPDGSPVGSFGSPGDSPGYFSKPKGVAADRRGLLYVADALFDAVQVFDRGGNLVFTFGRSGSAPGEFWMPTGLFVDGDGLIYVSDSYNRRIQIFRVDALEDEI